MIEQNHKNTNFTFFPKIMKPVAENNENMQKCICGKCPSYNDCMKEKIEGLYCSAEVGKSNCKFEKKGCICGACPVQIEHELMSGYYCETGAPK